MHELSIAQSIIQLAEKEAQKHHARQINEIELEIGQFAGVEWQTLAFALECTAKDSLLEKAIFIQRTVRGEGKCQDCHSNFPLESWFTPCPVCGSYKIQMIKGKELRIKSIIIQ